VIASRTRPFGVGPELATLIGASAVLLALRCFAASRVGYGDAEALYASYARHPQPAYLDHPGLIGVVARLLGGGAAPLPGRAHTATALLATLVPWAMVLACRACGAACNRSFAGGAIVALVPETAIGLFALGPDLPLALAWIGALGSAATALRAPPGSFRAWRGFAAAGVCAGVAATAKVSGGLLFGSLALCYASSAARPHGRTAAPWLGIAAGLLVVAPVVAFEARTGWPMLRHRLFDSQAGAGFSLRNAGALLGGQALYLSPLFAVIAALAARAAWTDRHDAVGSLLFFACALPAAVLVPLCVWSRVAEPHWLAPAELALVPAGARAVVVPGRRLMTAAGAMAASIVLGVHAWVLVPQLARPVPSYDARLDISNELYGWPQVLSAVVDEAARVASPTSAAEVPIVVGPHWVICAQLEAGLGGRLPVGCDTPIPDDFDTWCPRERWGDAHVLLWVTDARFGPPPLRHGYVSLRTRKVNVERAGRLVRAFEIATLVRGVAQNASGRHGVRALVRAQSSPLAKPFCGRVVLCDVAVGLDLPILVRRRDPSVKLVCDVLEHSGDRRDGPVTDASEAALHDAHGERGARIIEKPRKGRLLRHCARELRDAVGERGNGGVERSSEFGFDVGHLGRPLPSHLRPGSCRRRAADPRR